MHYLLIYEADETYEARRAPFRKKHFAHAIAAQERGELVLAGALANPIDGAVFVFQSDSPAVAEAFAKADPYVLNGVAKSWRVREWTTVVGKDAAVKVDLDTL